MHKLNIVLLQNTDLFYLNILFQLCVPYGINWGGKTIMYR
jgi:hypothetical protein